MMTPEKFREMCERHDLTSAFSDDHRYWAAGIESGKAIAAAREELGDEIAVPIWNSVTDTKIAECARDRFYWEIRTTK